jgi:hypothetical protein
MKIRGRTGQNVQHVFGSIAASGTSRVWLVIPSLEIFSYAEDACDAFGSAAPMCP